ncbi:hypothetical protein [Chitinophaga solisilvae]|uniref:hypothetical protein n=1 Tax=Chitinophaga solisilvae TaxID=1233460 RepID=UPI0013704F66|nr:hypothetical protein [Chitinophaga solisilvae]
MFVLLTIPIIFLIWYICRRFTPTRSEVYTPVPGEDARAVARITSVRNSAFSVASKYQRNIINTSEDRFITVAVNEIIKTNMGATYKTRLIQSLAPGEERRLGHADHVTEGKNKIYIGYEILWARFAVTPASYRKEKVMAQYAQPDILHPIHPALLKEIERRFREDGNALWT